MIRKEAAMKLFGGVIPVTGITFLLFAVFAVAFVGYLLGRITIKGVNLGTAGVFIIALVFGAIFYTPLGNTVTQAGSDGPINIASSALKIIETIGLILFVSAVGLIAGPNFFSNFKKNFKSYISLGFIIILTGALTTVVCFLIARGSSELSDSELISMLSGIMAGSLTSTPAFSAAKASVATETLQDIVSVGYGISYIFGVVGVVLFVQLMPKITRSNMEEERKKIQAIDTGNRRAGSDKGKIKLDPFGFCAFAFVVIVGILLGAIKIPLTSAGLSGTSFSLTNTGGVLIAGLIFGHLGHIGRVSFRIDKRILETFREFGLVLFLTGAGVSAGAKFIEYFKWVYFIYGIIITIVPMIIGFLFAKFVLKLGLLNTLGSITGGMTSTPALGTLIQTAGTDEVAAAYASTYPIALIAVVLSSQFLILIFS